MPRSPSRELEHQPRSASCARGQARSPAAIRSSRDGTTAIELVVAKAPRRSAQSHQLRVRSLDRGGEGVVGRPAAARAERVAGAHRRQRADRGAHGIGGGRAHVGLRE